MLRRSSRPNIFAAALIAALSLSGMVIPKTATAQTSTPSANLWCVSNAPSNNFVCKTSCDAWIGAYLPNEPLYIVSYYYEYPTSCNARLNNTGNATIHRRTYTGEQIDKQRQDRKNAGSFCKESGTACGNPINTGSGNKYQEELDFDLGDGLAFRRYYNSSGLRVDGNLGLQWRHSYSMSIEYSKDASGETADIFRPDGRIAQFIWNGSAWVAEAGDWSVLTSTRDGTGKVTGWTYYENGASRAEVYDATGQITSIWSRFGKELDFSYDVAQRQLVTVTNYLGRKLTFSYHPSRNIATVSLPDGTAYGYGYSSERLSTVTKPGSALRGYLYNEAGKNGGVNQPHILTGIVDESGQRFATFTYSSTGAALTTEHATGIEKFTAVYNANGTATVQTPSGASIARQFSIVNDRVMAGQDVTSCAGCVTKTTTRTYDTVGKPDLFIDAKGVVTDSDYDAQGLLTQIIRAKTTPEQQTESFQWNAGFRVPTQIDRAGQRQTFTHNAYGQVLTTTLTDTATGQSRTSTATYCNASDVTNGTCPVLGQIRSIDGPRTDVSDVTTYTYYASDEASCAAAPTTCPHRKGDLWKVTNALGQVTENVSYDGAGRLLKRLAANGVITDFTYTPRGQLSAIKVRGQNNGTEADDAITTISYNSIGLISTTLEPDGKYSIFSYDAAQRLTTVENNTGSKVVYTYDNASNVIKVSSQNPASIPTMEFSQLFNALGQATTIADGYSTPFDIAYDQNGNVDTTTDPLFRVSDSSYDALNRLKTSITNATGSGSVTAQIQYQYDARDNLVAVVDPKSLTTGYGYNGFDDLTAVTSPDTGLTSFTYNSGGLRQTSTDARGKTSTHGYDALGRLISVAFPNTAQNLTFTYDTNQPDCSPSELYGTGRLTKMQDESGNTRFCFDRFGREVRKVQAVSGGPTLTLGATYNAADNIISMTYPSGAIVTYVRGSFGEIEQIYLNPTLGAPQVALVGGTSSYPFGGPLRTVLFGNGRTLTKTYNKNYWPTAVSDNAAGGMNILLTPDAIGNVIGVSEQADPATAMSTRAYTYDGQDRLALVKNGPVSVQAFAYDSTGNRVSRVQNKTTFTQNYAPSNHRLQSESSIGGTTSRTYDANGNTTGRGAAVITYDDRNRMRDFRADGVNVVRTYFYNAKGERVSKIAPTSADNRYYLYSQNGKLLGEYLANGQRVQEYVWLEDTLVGILSDHLGGTYQYVETDHLGTPRMVIDPAQNKIVWRWNLTGLSFGETAPFGDPDADGTGYTLNMRFPGQWHDSESGLSYNYFRDYDPTTGRYLESDPIGLAGGASTFAYVAGSPINYVDELGLNRRLPPPPGNYIRAPLTSEVVAAATVPRLVEQIQAYNPKFRYETSWPQGGYRYGPQDVAFLRDVIRQYEARMPNACPAGAPINWGRTPSGIPFTMHYATERIDRQIPVSLVDYIARSVPGVPSRGAMQHYDPVSNVTVVVGRNGIVTAHKGE